MVVVIKLQICDKIQTLVSNMMSGTFHTHPPPQLLA